MTQSATEWLRAWTSSSHGKHDQERRAAVIALGLVQALRSADVSLEEAREDLFNVETYEAFRRRRLDRRLVEMLEWAMELPTVVRNVPGGVGESLAQIERLATAVLTKPGSARQSRGTNAKVRRAAGAKAK